MNNASTLGASPLPALGDDRPRRPARARSRSTSSRRSRCCRRCARTCAAGATIVNITSDAAVEAYEGWGGYGASKAALEHAGRVLAAEQPDLRVLVVDPGDMRTEMHQDAFPGEDISDRPPPEASVPGARRARSRATSRAAATPRALRASTTRSP